jgi:hypothetical protein
MMLLACCTSGARFAAELPRGVPDISGWERKAGRTTCVNPAGVIDYQLFVSPSRPSLYSVTRYRVTLDSRRLPENEKLQWDRDGVDVRRYECRQGASDAEPCQWREFPRGSREYDAELGALVAVYFGSAPGLIERTPPSPSPAPATKGKPS